MNNSSGVDRALLFSAVTLALVGVFMVYSATAVMAVNGKSGSFAYLIRHMISLAIGFGAMAVFTFIDYRELRKLAVPLLIASFALLILVFMPVIGIKANGAQRWLRLWPTTFQPSELAKLAFVIFLADYVSRPNGFNPATRANVAMSLKQKMEHPVTGFAMPLGIMLLFQVVLIKQPDFGAVMNLGIITVTMLILGGVRMKFFLAFLPFALAAIFMLVQAPYRMRRITSFLDPWGDERGSGYQLVQSLISFGNGGLGGLGLGKGQQKLFFLPEPHTDFIFSMIGEELGFIGAIFVIGLFLVVFARGMKISARAGDAFGKYLAFGLTFMIVLQAILNAAVSTGLMPTKGLPLPFVSYGGSSLLVSLSAAGILLNISSRQTSGVFLSNAAMRHSKRFIANPRLAGVETHHHASLQADATHYHASLQAAGEA
ncbi:MAG: putative lipid II flippase FtsW [Nitrospirae bacterium]|nr:putative lipid II flippase FtsW [Nitrospirota bacterium]